MTLSTQLARGTLALPMLALFAALALFANQPAEAEPYLDTHAAAMAEAQAANACAALPRPTLLLAQAPADLGPIAQRNCRRA